VGSEYRTNIFAASGGEGRPVKGLEAGEVPVGWSSDGKFLYCQKLGSEIPFGIVRIDLASGLRALWKQITPPDPVGITFIEPVFLSSDLKSYAYSVDRRLDVLYFVNELH
jgi:hypothetical protein